jgi:hypothetical protein
MPESRIKLSISVMMHPKRAKFTSYLQEKLQLPLSKFSIDQKNNLLENSKASWMLHDPEATHHVVVQDDCIVCDNFRERVEQFLTERETERIRLNKPPQAYNFFLKRTSRETFEHSKGYYTDNCTRAGLAICLPTNLIKPMLEEFDRQFSRHDDDRISEYLRKHNYKVVFPVPSFIDHRIELESLAGNVVGNAAYKFIDAKPITVPKIIHQLWIGDKPRPEKWMRTWKEYNSEWEYRVWDNNAVMSTKWVNQKHVDYYLSRGIWPGVSDVCTYEILHNHGGLMMSADSVCCAPIDELFTDGRDSYGVYENEKVRPGLISPLMGSIKGGLFAAELIEGLRQKQTVGEPWLTVGNKYMGEMFLKTKQNVKIFPSYYFNPEHFTGEKYEGDDKIYAHQMWGTTRNTYANGMVTGAEKRMKFITYGDILKARNV